MRTLLAKIASTIIVVATTGALAYFAWWTFPYWGPDAVEMLYRVGQIIAGLAVTTSIAWGFIYFVENVLPHKNRED